jgi:vitamin B12 transporter
MKTTSHRIEKLPELHLHRRARHSGEHAAKTAGAIGALLVALAAGPSAAQVEGETALEGIVVESTTISLTPVETSKVGSAVSVITGEQLEQRQIRHAADALRSVPGVAVSRTGSFGGNTQVRVRGAEANHVLVLIDGIQVNDTVTGEFDFASLLSEDIERIEVIRGPQSGLWGSNALAGVINIVTRTGEGPLQIVGRGEGGSFSTTGGSLSVRGGTDRMHGALSFVGRNTAGFNISDNGTEQDGAEQLAFHAKGGFNLTQNISVDGFARRSSNVADIDSFEAAPDAIPGDFATSVDLRDDINETQVETYQGKLNIDLFDNALQTDIYANRNETTVISRNPIFGDASNNGQRDKHGVLSKLTLETHGALPTTHYFSGLIEQEKEFFTPSTDFIERDRELQSYVGEYRGEFGDIFFVNAAVRDDQSDSFQDFTTHKVAGALLFPAIGTRLHSSYGTGVVFPSMFEQFGVIPGFFTPNPDLLPEESEGWDAGVEQSFFGDAFVVDVTYFEQNLTNEIFSTFFGPPENLPGESTRDGIEVAATLRLFENAEIVGSYTYLNAKEPDGKEEVRRPPHSGSVNAVYHFAEGRGLINLSTIYNGKMRDVVFDAFTFEQSRLTLDEYVLVDLAAHYDLKPNIQIFGRVENLLNENYEEVFGFNTAEIGAYGGLKIRLSADDVPEIDDEY